MPKFSATHLIDCTYEQHAVAILAILNYAIAHTTARYEYQPRNLDYMRQWFADKQAHACPVIGVLDDHGQLLGFASWDLYHPYEGYKYTVEHSVYLHPEHTGKGLGRLLLTALIDRARQNPQVHVLIACIDNQNIASIALHKKLGFSYSGTLKQVGYKFGQWLDADFYQLTFDGL